MSQELIVRRRRARASSRHRQGSAIRFGPAFAAGPAGAISIAADAPSFQLADPESLRGTFVSAFITALLHACVIVALLLFAWLAPDVVEQIIEVRLIKEAPKLPAPKALASRRPSAASLAASPRAIAQSGAPAVAARISPEALRMAELDALTAPRAIDRRQVESQKLDAQKSLAPRVAPVIVEQAALVTVRPSDLKAPAVRIGGPTEIADVTQVDVATPQALSGSADVTGTAYTGEGAILGAELGDGAGAYGTGFTIDTGVGRAYGGVGPGGGGDTGPASGPVSCMERAQVQAYLITVKDRTMTSWDVPAGTPPNEKVVLSFELDSSGTAVGVEVVTSSSARLGNSALQALRSASPFPPMSKEVRCLAQQRLHGTFDVPAL